MYRLKRLLQPLRPEIQSVPGLLVLVTHTLRASEILATFSFKTPSLARACCRAGLITAITTPANIPKITITIKIIQSTILLECQVELYNLLLKTDYYHRS